MSDRDWTKEMSKIDKQLESISDKALFPAGGSAVPASTARPAAEPSRTSTLGVFARLTLSVALGVGMVVWPYEARCGLGLAAYLAAVATVLASGVWSAVWTWRHRAGRAHTLSLLIILWGGVLGGMQVLPRVGYAKPDPLHPATWACEN